jgi:tetratricopeptide (TPR) repeat protein
LSLTSSRLFSGASLLFGLLGALEARATAPLDSISLLIAREGLEELYHGRTEQARSAFERIRARHPASPAADFFLGGIEWQRITTGPQGFTEGGAAEEAFFSKMDAAIARGEAILRKSPDDLSTRFFTGGAYGYEARYLALQEKWWDAYRRGKRGVEHLEHVVDKDPAFADAYLGLGIYHYYTAVIPTVFKFLGGLIGLHGDRERGLEEIRRALEDGSLVNAECRFFLAEIHTSFEEDHWAALGYSRSLRDEYPENELFAWLNARVLDELHLVDLASAEWNALRQAPRSRRLTGFLDYRLARSLVFGGNFEGAAGMLKELLDYGRLGSVRMTMWGRIRYGFCLDLLGKHEDAMKQYALAHELDDSDPARERTTQRLEAGKRDPSVLSLLELKEAARILRETKGHEEEFLRSVEDLSTKPSRGLTSSEVTVFFEILRDLAEARLRRGDDPSAIAAIDRALSFERRPPPDSRADLLILRSRALDRLGRSEEADSDLDRAASHASFGWRRRVEKERELRAKRAAALATGPFSPSSNNAEPSGSVVTFRAPDRGELLFEVEGDFLPQGLHLTLALQDGFWSGRVSVHQDSLRYRFLADGIPRPDPLARRIVLVNDQAWCVLTRGDGADSVTGSR